jgi:DNA-directed RNA polymerase I, II, and III subunit RPABC1
MNRRENFPEFQKKLYRLYRIRQVCINLLKNRQYVLASGECEIPYSEFCEFFNDRITKEELTILAFKKPDPNVQIFVFFVDCEDGKDKISRKTISTYYQRMKREGVSRSILVIPEKLSPQAVKSLDLIAKGTSGTVIIETFQESELLVNITEHVLVPKHQVLTTGERIQLLERYNVTTKQLPRILRSDPVARYLGLEPGDIVKILRPSETAGRYITYRACLL